MNRAEPSAKPDDDLDGLLRAFFGKQMPSPWPSPRLPAARGSATQRPPAAGRSRDRSRWSLAASIGLLFLGSLFLSGRFTSSIRPGDSITGPTVSDRHLRLRMEKEHRIKEHENRNREEFGAPDDELDMPSIE